MKKIIITIFGVLLLFMSNNIFSQEEDIRLKSDTILLKTRSGLDKEESPKSYNSDITPEVASLIRSINTPVSYYIGRPDISIPIEEIKLKDYKHLIKLEYNATGNQLRDIPAYAGLGWNMPASGMITRKINGYNDNLLVGSGAGAVIDKSLMDTYNFKINNSDWRAGKFPAIYDYSSLNVFGIYAEPHVREVLSNQTPYLDEFYINVGDIKASFYLYKDNKGELVTKISSQTNLGFKVSDIKSGYDYTDHAISSTEDYLGNKYSTAFSFKIPVKYDMLEITITDNNGVK